MEMTQLLIAAGAQGMRGLRTRLAWGRPRRGACSAVATSARPRAGIVAMFALKSRRNIMAGKTLGTCVSKYGREEKTPSRRRR